MKFYCDPSGCWFQEFISMNYQDLQDKAEHFKKLGKKVYLHAYDECAGISMLTVVLGDRS